MTSNPGSIVITSVMGGAVAVTHDILDHKPTIIQNDTITKYEGSVGIIVLKED